jgi:hypothetical protein
MNDNIKVGVGFLIPTSAIILFIASLYAENFLLSAFISILGILVWFLYSAIMQTNMPNVTGNIIILFGVLLSIAVFLSFGVKRNMFGGYELAPEGGAGSAILLLIIVLVGILFKNNSTLPAKNTQPASEDLSSGARSSEKQEQPQSQEAFAEEGYYDDDDYYDDEDYYDGDEYEELEDDEQSSL